MMKINRRYLFHGALFALSLSLLPVAAYAKKGEGGKPGGGGGEPPAEFNPEIVVNSGGIISIMNADGSGAVRIADAGTDLAYPAWSPDGTRLAYVRSPGRELVVVSADPSAPSETVIGGWDDWWDAYPVAWGLVPTTDSVGNEYFVEKIVHSNQIADGQVHLIALNPDGTGSQVVQRLEGGFGYHSMNPEWIPGGNRIAFRSLELDGFYDSHIIIADVEIDENGDLAIVAEEDLTQRLLDDYNFVVPGDFDYLNFSNTSDKILSFSENVEGWTSIYVLDFSATPVLRDVLMDPVEQIRDCPSWSPDDSELLFRALQRRSEKGGVFKVKADGSTVPESIFSEGRANWWPNILGL